MRVSGGTLWLLLLLSASDAFTVRETSTRNGLKLLAGQKMSTAAETPFSQLSLSRRNSYSTTLRSSSNSNEKGDIVPNFNAFYGALWITFLAFGVFFSPGSIGDPKDMAMIQAYVENPSSPQGINPIFLVIFNGLGVMPLVISQLACPQGSKEGPPSAPFLVASLGMGYGAAGLYLALKSPPVDSKMIEETSWFTRNVLESKIACLASLCLLASAVYSATMGLQGDYGWAAAGVDFVSLAQQSKFVSVSTVDLSILTIAAASLIPRDLQLRMEDTDEAYDFGKKIALGTLLLPILGASMYCLWRPSLPEAK